MDNYNYKITEIAARRRADKDSEASSGGSRITVASSSEYVNDAISDLFEKVNVGTDADPVWAIRAKLDFYSDGEVSAYGIGSSSGGSGGASMLADLNDVALSSLGSGQLLRYDGTHWVNIDESAITPDLTGYATEEWVSGKIPTALPNPYALAFGTKSYDGGAAMEITASDLGAATTSDLAKYLPLSGGTMTGAITTFSGSTGSPNIIIPNGNFYIKSSGGVGFISGNSIQNTVALTTDGSFRPIYDSAGLISLGSSSLRWKDGYFSGTVYATTFSGNATSATKLATARTIWGQSFDGTADVTGNFTTNGFVRLSGTGNSTSGLYPNANITSGGDASRLWLYNGTGLMLYGGTELAITPTGVGIGTSSPLYKLDVSGTGRFTDALVLQGTLTASGQAALNGGATIPADKTLKIGDCEITYDADNECLTFSKTIASNGDVVAYK
jgi:hypothetical protein